MPVRLPFSCRIYPNAKGGKYDFTLSSCCVLIYPRTCDGKPARCADKPMHTTQKRKTKMTTNTSAAIKAILAADTTVSQDEAKAALEALAGKAKETDNGDRVLSRAEVAAMLGKSVKAVDIYGRRGIIRRVYLTGGGGEKVQAQGYSRNSVLEAMARGKPTAAK